MVGLFSSNNSDGDGKVPPAIGMQSPVQMAGCSGADDEPETDDSVMNSNTDLPFNPRDPELQGLSLYEKKLYLINRELDAMGMGRYQWYIWTLCGLGYFLDLMWAQAFGLIISPLQQELGFGDPDKGNIFSAFSAGLCAGAFVWGVLVDIIGRKWAFNGTVLIATIFGICLGAPNTYSAVLVLTAFNGFGIGGNIPIDTTICLEFLPQNNRYVLALLSIFQPLGVVVCSGIAYGFIPNYSCAPDLVSCNNVAAGQPCCSKADNYGWRYLMFTMGGISLFVFLMRFVVFTFQESPKFLLSKGQDEAALQVLQEVARTNGKKCRISMITFRTLETAAREDSISSGSDHSATEMVGQPQASKLSRANVKERVHAELERLKILFSTPALRRLTILVWIIYAFDYWGFSIAGSFLPTILLEKNKSINVGVAETYRDYVIIYLPGIVGVGLGSLMVHMPRFGRKLTLLVSSALMAVSLFLFAAVNTQAANVGLNVMEYFFQSMFNAVLYGWTPEAFPAPVRGTASGIASFWGRLFSIFSPLIAARLLVSSLNGPLYLAGAGVFVCTAAIAFLPSASLGGESM